MKHALTTRQDWRHRWMLLVQKIERVQTIEEQQHLMNLLSHPAKPFVLAFANAHAMNSIVGSVAFFNAINAADIVLRDGSGMATLYKLLSLQPGINLNGTDLIPQLIKLFNGRRIALFGTQNPHLKKGLDMVAHKLSPDSSCVSAHGFHHVAAYIKIAAKHQSALIVLGMGMPRQEEVAAELRLALTFPCLIICGGAIIDFLANKTPRAPLWLRRAGLEWVFRLGMEPRRLFQRYVIGNPLFLTRALRLASVARLQ